MKNKRHDGNGSESKRLIFAPTEENRKLLAFISETFCMSQSEIVNDALSVYLKGIDSEQLDGLISEQEWVKVRAGALSDYLHRKIAENGERKGESL